MLSDIELIQHIAQVHQFEIQEISSLAGGSINQVYLIKSSKDKKVVKINSSEKFPGMFPAEKNGLEALKETNTFDVPKVFDYGELDGKAFLLLEYKKEESQKGHFRKVFGKQLANLHKNTADSFGFHSDNFIGSLPQYNKAAPNATDFYINSRLEPQVAMASKNGFFLGDLSGFYKNISEEIPDEPPALIHGDLWSGNYLINEEGLPCLIDPAVCYGPREMDLAMMKLFGGFSEKVFETYHACFPLQPNWQKRIPIWQLYYLLVHLNLFGSSYLPQVKRTIKDFS